ncbi:glycosyl hydrolase 108 family protein, partial [Escherichia coli]|uniref:glycosyl hydrolase 108 family protein n=2 Tax=Pseudomonadota TaxID=1224 RepID=UPI0039E1CC90
GGFVDHPADRGRATRWGITAAVARAEGYDGPIAALPRGVAAVIYRRLYWEAAGLPALAIRAPRLAAELFDTGVNMGVATAA